MKTQCIFIKTIISLTTLACLLLMIQPATANTVYTSLTPQMEEATTLDQAPIPPKKKCGKFCPVLRPKRLFKKGQLDLHAGIGLLPTYFLDDAETITLPMQLALDYRFSEKFSLGVGIGHSSSRSQPEVVSDGILATWKNEQLLATLRPTMHVTSIDHWDFYLGSAIGIQQTKITGETDGDLEALKEYQITNRKIEPSKTQGVFNAFAGFRHVVTPKVQVGAELGFGISIMTVGVSYRLM